MTAPKENNIYRDEESENYDDIKAGIWSCYETFNMITADELIKIFDKTGFKPIEQLSMKCRPKSPEFLTHIYSRETLKTERLVALFKKKGLNFPQIWLTVYPPPSDPADDRKDRLGDQKQGLNKCRIKKQTQKTS